MTELDFDELDRAVNSLMSKTQKVGQDPISADKLEKENGEGPSSTPSSTVNVPTSLPPIDVPPASSVSSSVSGPTSLSPTPSSPSITSPSQPRGRFMDVMRPNANSESKLSSHGVTSIAKNTSSNHEIELAPPSKLAPISSQGVAVNSSKPISPLAVLPAQEESQSSEEKSEKNDWPDPLNVTVSDNSKLNEEKNDLSSIDDTVTPLMPANIDNANDKSDTPAPLSSPFLPDTKVEKRPLGAVVSSEVSPSENSEESEINEASKTEDQPSQSIPEHQATPEELDTDLMAIESGSQIEADVEAVAATPAIQERTAPLINSQYASEPAEVESTNGAIYDTANYHQPLSHPAKKTGSLGIVFGIIGILLAGVGLGAAAYFFHFF
jgi:hypothetical protein